MSDHRAHQDSPDARPAGAPAQHADDADAQAFRELLRGLRVWDVALPSFDPATAPVEPLPCSGSGCGRPPRPVSPSRTP